MPRTLALALLAVLPGLAHAAGAEGRVVEVRLLQRDGTRVLARVDLDRLPQVEARRDDPQYGQTVWMRGAPLEAVLAAAPVPADVDVALLRFDDGLAIPVAFRDRALMARLRPFVARALIATPGPYSQLVAGQVEDPRRPPTPEDVRPVRFSGNKVVVSDAGHPDVLSTIARDLRPWLYADSLAYVDLYQRAAWERQLDLGPGVAEGRAVFLGSCRFCHAVRGVGGMMGWDFVDPLPIYSDEWNRRMGAGAQERNPTPGRTLLGIHVRYRADGGGRSMPALRSMHPEQIKALWAWLQAAAGRPLPPYAPSR